MKLLFLGDVMGRTGRAAVAARLPAIRSEWALDFVVVNGENATGGAGLSAAHAKALLDAGADCVTLRPLNFARTAPGKGARVYEARGGRRVLVAQVLGQVFMKRPFDDPFSAIDAALRAHPLGGAVAAAVVDVHCEATSEKMGLGHWCDGRASLVVGTHTHVPTADAQILAGGTAYQSDAGMCGDYNSVIGMDRLEPMRRFVTGMAKERFTPAEGEATLCGTYVETDERTGRALRIVAVRIGGRLAPAAP